MDKNRILIIWIFLCIVSCGSKDVKKSATSDKAVIEAEVKKSQKPKTDLYDGFYLNNWNNSGVLLIYKEKIHHFARQQFESIYKDEEYDFSGLEEGFLFINRTYRLDRNNNIISKNTILKDIRPVIKDGKTIALERNGRTFERMNNYGSFLEKFSWNLEQITEQYANKWKVDASQINQALTTIDFYKDPILSMCVLRDGAIHFEVIIEEIVQSNHSR